MSYVANVEAMDFMGRKARAQIVGSPDTCPRCHRHVLPHFREVTYNGVGKTLQAVFQCASVQCQEAFISNYAQTPNSLPGGGWIYSYVDSVPLKPPPAAFPALVKEVSPSFVLIYDQAMAAEAHDLDQVVGIALRKALEFLIKDFCIAERPGDEEAIKACPLATCIENYVSDSTIKQVAKRAVWLGNDETHYVRKWAARDVQDLKTLVKLTVNWIDSSLTTKQYLAEMPVGAGGPVKP